MARFDAGSALPGRPGSANDASSGARRPGDLADELLRSQVEAPPLFSLDGGASGRSPTRSTRQAGALGSPRQAEHQLPAPAQVRAALSEAAHARLGRSATRVDRMLETAAAEQLSLGATIARIRRMSIRGVTPTTLRNLAAELESVALAVGPGTDPPVTPGGG